MGEEPAVSTPTSWRRAWPAQALFTHAPADGARPARAVEAAPDAAADSGRARQHQGPARDLRQGRHRDAARRAEVHRRRAAARVLERRRPAPARRSRRCADAKRRRRSAPTSSISKPTSRRGRAPRSASAASKFEQKLRLEEGLAMPIDRLLAIADARAGGHAGGIPDAGRPAERRRSARGLGAHQGGAPGARRADRRRPPARSTSCATFLERQRLDLHAAAANRSPWRRRRTSTAGRSPACGRRVRSRAKPTRAYYYLTDVDPAWPPERQDEHLRDYNYPTLWSISIHEVYPGPLPALPAPAPGRIEGAQVDPVRAGVVRRRLGALLRADDGGGRLRPRATTASSSDSWPRR